MMINRRLIHTVNESKKYIAGNVLLQWCGLTANIVMIFSITSFLQKLSDKTATTESLWPLVSITLGAVAVRYFSTIAAAKMSYLSSKSVKKKLRELIYGKLLRLGTNYNEQIGTSEVVQVSVEGVDQLETYFGAYLPQFFYSMLAPITLFIVLSFVSFPAAIALLICVPLIPIAIAAVQAFAKKLLSKYWSQYTTLGDTFLENLQGLTTLKIYQADKYKNDQMNSESEKFRKVTMKVLTMQLNSVTTMDLIAYGGAALGVILSVVQFHTGKVSLAGCLAIILLSADYFIPMRMLGSYFHIAMNGMAASDKIFKLLDLPEENQKIDAEFPFYGDIICSNLHFSYGSEREILHGVDLEFPRKSLSAIVGESGSGKSTIAAILMGHKKGYNGEITVGNTKFCDISQSSIMQNITYVSRDSYLFKGTVRENLLMGKQTAEDSLLWQVLHRVNLDDFLKSEHGLDTKLFEKAGNLSGGQRQRLALARAILHDSPIYIFDEATSNIDADSENEIMAQIYALAKTKTVILITHRIANAAGAGNVYVLQNGCVNDSGKHQDLLKKNGVYYNLWNTQSLLEHYGREVPV